MELHSRKCNEKAKEFLLEAANFHSKSNHYKAIEACNAGLCYAEPKSCKIAEIFAKRSEIYFDLGRYQLSVNNIKLARQSLERLPEKLPELDELERKCQAKISKHPEEDDKCVWDFFKLTHQPNQKIPFISSHLRPLESWKFGRCVITTKNLHPGDIIAIEEPFFRMLNRDSRYQRCASCMKSNCMSLIPCDKCTTTMFCSSTCLESGWTKFHKFECSEQALDDLSEYDAMILKCVFESVELCGGLKQLQAFTADTKSSATVFDYDLGSTANSHIGKSLLKSIMSLKKGKSSDEDLMMAEWIAASHPSLSAQCQTIAQKDFLRDFIIRVMGIIDRNSYIFYCPSLHTSYVDEEVGSGVFPFASLINHSCSPNLYRTFVDNKQVFIVKKPIESGQQLFVGYHANFAFSPRDERQEFLLKDFLFKCSCDACTDNFPLMQNLKKCDKNFQPPPATAKSYEDAKDIFRQNCQFVKENREKFPFPCFEMCTVMQNSYRHLQYIAGKKFLVEKL